jgi:hypothetical protein
MNTFLEKVDRVFDECFPNFEHEYIRKDNFTKIIYQIHTNYIDNCFVFKKNVKNKNTIELWELIFKIAILLFNKEYNVSLLKQIEVKWVYNIPTKDYSFMFNYKEGNKYIGQVTKSDINKYIKKFK